MSAPTGGGVAEYPWERLLGAHPHADAGVEFRVWAPHARAVALRLGDHDLDLEHAGYGVYEAIAPAQAGDDYWFVLDGRPLPDPCSRWQPDGIRGPSRIVDLPGPAPFTPPVTRDLVIYELHIGTFTDEGTFDAAIEHLPGLAELGVTAIEIMPVAEFPGHHGWGYDGVYISAAHSAYGGPHALARLVGAAHEAGLAVILDVVYNHVGASGTPALEAFGPYFTGRYSTPWGRAINYDDADCDPVREWVLQSAVGWVRDSGFDGLRLDAIHAIFDASAEHIVAAVARRVHAVRDDALVIAESGLNDPRVMRDRAVGGWGCDGAWADDFHHSVRTLVTGELDGYYADFGSVAQLAKAWHRPYVYDGNYSPLPPPPVRRAGRRRAARAIRGVRPEPRPGREPRLRRPPASAGTPSGRVLHAALAVCPDAVHGRGVRRERAVSVLLGPHRRVDRAGHARRPPRGVRVVRRVRRRGDSRPSGSGDVRALEADAPARSRARRAVRRPDAHTPANAPGRRRRDRVRRGRAVAVRSARRIRADDELRLRAAPRAVLGRVRGARDHRRGARARTTDTWSSQRCPRR